MKDITAIPNFSNIAQKTYKTESRTSNSSDQGFNDYVAALLNGKSSTIFSVAGSSKGSEAHIQKKEEELVFDKWENQEEDLLSDCLRSIKELLDEARENS